MRFIQQTYSRLWETMKTTSSGSTNMRDGYDGISSYCSTYACNAAKGSDFKDGLDWNWFKTNINNGNFMIVDAAVRHYENNGGSGYHAFSGVGYQETSTGNYIRVGDQ